MNPNAKIFITSDIHFSHEKIIQYCPDRGSSVEEMNEKIVRNWNSVVSPDDHTYILGDVAMGKIQDAPKYIRRLNGTKTLILGNHDKTLKKLIKNDPSLHDMFDGIHSYFELTYRYQEKKHLLVLCHFRFADFNQHHNGTVNFHGHNHSSPENIFRSEFRQMDVGMDGNNMFPHALDDAMEMVLKRPIKSTHHD